MLIQHSICMNWAWKRNYDRNKDILKDRNRWEIKIFWLNEKNDSDMTDAKASQNFKVGGKKMSLIQISW